MTKHTYTRELAPTNTGSVSRPARLNLRLTCEARARTHKLFCDMRELLGLPKDWSYADIWENSALFALEHIVWNLRESPSATKEFMRSLFRRLPQEDYARNRFAALKSRFEPQRKAEQQELAITA